jgi:hypothetical protein
VDGASGAAGDAAGDAAGGAGFEVAAATTSFATDFPAAATPDNTFIALLINPMVSATVEAEIRPARIVSSTPSAKR